MIPCLRRVVNYIQSVQMKPMKVSDVTLFQSTFTNDSKIVLQQASDRSKHRRIETHECACIQSCYRCSFYRQDCCSEEFHYSLVSHKVRRYQPGVPQGSNPAAWAGYASYTNVLSQQIFAREDISHLRVVQDHVKLNH